MAEQNINTEKEQESNFLDKLKELTTSYIRDIRFNVFKNVEDISNESINIFKDAVNSKIQTTWTIKDYKWFPDNSAVTSVQPIYNTIQNPTFKARFGKFTESLENIFSAILNNNKYIDKTPRIIITEFEPAPSYFSIASSLLSTLELGTTMGKGAFEAITGNKEVVNEVKKLFTPKGFAELLNQAKINSTALSSVATSISGKEKFTDLLDDVLLLNYKLPLLFYKYLLNGRYLRQFEIPIYQQDNKSNISFIEADGSKGWNVNSFGSLEDNTFVKLGKTISKTMGGMFNIPVQPSFELDGIGPTPPELNAEFYLYNYNLADFERNLRFIIALTSGMLWMQSGLIARPSNLYQVRIPGYLAYFLCTMKCNISSVGKIRYLNSKSNYTLELPLLQNADANHKITIPDGYKVNLSIQSIIPNTFNNMLYVLSDEPEMQPTAEELRSLLLTVLESINNKLKQIIK